MRSNDVILGLPHDIFSFTMLQEILATQLSVELGTYKHVVGSLHLYDHDQEMAGRFLDEGWQATDMPMPAMPRGDPWPAITSLLVAEEAIRHGRQPDMETMQRFDSYWGDLVRLLQILRSFKDKDADKMEQVQLQMASPIYQPFIAKKIGDCRDPIRQTIST